MRSCHWWLISLNFSLQLHTFRDETSISLPWLPDYQTHTQRSVRSCDWWLISLNCSQPGLATHPSLDVQSASEMSWEDIFYNGSDISLLLPSLDKQSKSEMDWEDIFYNGSNCVSLDIESSLPVNEESSMAIACKKRKKQRNFQCSILWS